MRRLCQDLLGQRQEFISTRNKVREFDLSKEKVYATQFYARYFLLLLFWMKLCMFSAASIG